MNGQPSPQDLTLALHEKLALLKELRRKRAITAEVADLFQYEMQIKQCRAAIHSLAERIESSITHASGE